MEQVNESSSKAAAPQPSGLASVREWLVQHKLRAVGTIWAAGIVGSIAYNFRKPGEKFSVKIIHARLHAQALTLGALVAAAGVEYWEHHSGDKVKRIEDHLGVHLPGTKQSQH